MDVFKQKCFIRAKVLVLGKLVVFGQSGCYLAEVVDSVESDCIREKVVVFGKKWLY